MVIRTRVTKPIDEEEKEIMLWVKDQLCLFGAITLLVYRPFEGGGSSQCSLLPAQARWGEGSKAVEQSGNKKPQPALPLPE